MTRRALWLLALVLAGGASTDAQPATRPWHGIVVHHSATPTGDVETFRRYHVQVRGWEDVGYHYVITRDGTVQAGRPLWKVGAHARGRNADHIGICLVGEDDFTAKQVSALKSLVRQLQATFPLTRIERHHEHCPGPGVDLSTLGRANERSGT